MIYYRGGNRRIGQIVADAEEASESTCERCGEYGTLHVFDEEWYWTFCEPCAQRRADERRMSVRDIRPGEVK